MDTTDSTGSLVMGNGEQLDNSQLAPPMLSMEEVDRLADELVTEYSNPGYREWYCKVIYEFGPERVRYWQKKCRGGKTPARLFSFYVKQARSGKPVVTIDKVQTETPPQYVGTSTDRLPKDEDVDNHSPELHGQQLDEALRIFGIEPVDSVPKAIPWRDDD